MSAVPASLFLTDFGSDEPAAAIADETLREAAAAAEERSAELLEQGLEEAYARGLEEGNALAQAQAEARLEEQKVAFAAELAAAREAWVREEGQRIGELVKTSIDAMEERIALATERILKPFVAQAVREAAIVELRAMLKDLAASNPGAALEISGPEDLLEEVRGALSTSVAVVSYIASEAIDVQVKAGASVIETRIAEWLRQLEGGE